MSSKNWAGLKERLDGLNQRIEKALHEALRNRAGLTMIAVSKRQPVAAVRAAYDQGIRHFGENQIQEGIPKVRVLPDDIIWHFIGHLQKNKVRKAVKNFAYLHGIDSLSLLQRIDVLACEERVHPKAFLQVNYALDPDKQGLHPEAVKPVMEAALGLKNVTCIGLMGIPPQGSNPEKTEAYFRGMVALRDELRESFTDWPGKLSLGMSGDFELAIGLGAHYIRVGTVLFGERVT